jgi:hypothetical protein
VFLILLEGVTLSGVLMAMLVPATGEGARWLALPIPAPSIAPVWWYASRTSRRSTAP